MGFEELWDGFDKICEKTAAGEEFTKSIIKYLEKRHEVEAKYLKGLAHLAPMFGTDREDGTIQNAWFSLRDETEALSKERAGFCADLQKLIDDIKAQLTSDRKNRGELLAKGRKLVKDLAATEEIHKQARLKYVEARKKQQKSDENFKKIKAQGGNTTKPEKTLKKDKEKANTADHEYRKKVVQLANAQDKFHLDDMPSLLKEFEAFERGRLTATRKHFLHFTTLQASLGPSTTQSTERFKRQCEAIDSKSDLDLYVQKNRPTSDQPPPRAQYMSWDGTVVEDVGPPRAKGASSTKLASSQATSTTKIASSNNHKDTAKDHKNDHKDSEPVKQTETTMEPTQSSVVPTDANFRQRTLTALYAYEATEDGELTFDEGAQILVLLENDSGWWRGRLPNGQEGLFPSNFMAPESVAAPIAAPAAASSDPVATQEGTSEPAKADPEPAPVATQEPEPAAEAGGNTVPINARYIALYDYDAEDDTEMTIHEGDVLFVISETDGWYFGTNADGKQGNFPSNFVEPHTGG